MSDGVADARRQARRRTLGPLNHVVTSRDDCQPAEPTDEAETNHTTSARFRGNQENQENRTAERPSAQNEQRLQDSDVLTRTLLQAGLCVQRQKTG